MPEPKPQEEIEELPQDLLKEEPPEIPPTKDMQEALQSLKELDETRDAARAAEERKRIIEARDKASTERMRRELGASVLQELPPEHVQLEGEEDWTAEAARNLGPRKVEPPPIPEAAKKPAPPAKKSWWKRLLGRE